VRLCNEILSRKKKHESIVKVTNLAESDSHRENEARKRVEREKMIKAGCDGAKWWNEMCFVCREMEKIWLVVVGVNNI
jgi:hypothetical protein